MNTNADVHSEVLAAGKSVPPEQHNPTDSQTREPRVEELSSRTPGNCSADKGLTPNPLPAEQIVAALKALKRGDFDVRLAGAWSGISGQVADEFNELAEMMGRSSEELSRISRIVGREGKLQERLSFGQASAGWADRIFSINSLIDWLAGSITENTRVIQAVTKGDLTQNTPVETDGRKLEGEILRSAETLNSMVTQLRVFALETNRVAREVGMEGKLGGQARVEGVAGTWKELTDNVNFMAGNLTSQVRNIAEVTRAVANGDLSRKICINVRGEILELKNNINTMVDRLSSFASEVTRVAREVGTEGKLGGQAQVKGVSGTWKDLTDSVNSMANNLTAQVRNIAEVTTAVANGDLSNKITVDVKGEILQLKQTINTMVDQLRSFAAEVTRVAREVGTEGKLGGQAQVKGGTGTWKDLTDSVNSMAANLTAQVRNIAEVTIAVADGNLSRKITVDVKGEMLQLKDAINTMVDRLRSFSSEVTRVAREVGTEGKLGGQAQVKGVAGTWKDLTDSVNSMAGNLTAQVRNIAEVTTAVANGDLSKKITVDVNGEILQLKETINTMVDQLRSFVSEVTRVAWEVGTEGKLGGQAQVKGGAGTWKDLTDSVNSMAGNLTAQVRNIAEVTTSVANGDLSKKITVAVKGEILQLKDTINTMVDQLRSFASEVTRVAREVGTEGKLGGQAEVKDLGGTWRDLTDSVNSMASNLTGQVRDIATVTTAVANGDLTRKITVDVKGEILELKNTINSMVDRLSAFTDEVTRVAQEVGLEGKLGGQASVSDADGIWKELTENVNQLATNLTTQVRAIAEVATAVANGEVTRFIELDARGEVAALRDSINQMIRNLRETSLKLEQRVAALTDINRELEAFSYSISHDLRAPLRSMSSFAQALLDQEGSRLDADGIDFARRIRRAAQYMDTLLQDLLAYSRLARTDMPLITVRLEEAVNEVLNMLETDIQQSGGKVEIVSPLGTVRAHPPTLKQILANLIGNSIKFVVPHRPLRLRIFTTPQPGFTRLWVEDNGIGIAREYHEKIFGLFQRLHGPQKYPGTGVGLALVRKGTERMGGLSGLESQPGQGSRFWVELPAADNVALSDGAAAFS